jgi:hypothetical protein
VAARVLGEIVLAWQEAQRPPPAPPQLTIQENYALRRQASALETMVEKLRG